MTLTPCPNARRGDPGPSPTVVLELGPDTADWYRRLGPLAWLALQHLALHAHPLDDHWAAPLGVRGLAAGIGVTKDTAARALTTLTRAGLVTRYQMITPDGHRRSGYRLHLPEPLRLHNRPALPDHQPKPRARRPELGGTPATSGSLPHTPDTDTPATKRDSRQQTGTGHEAMPAWDQPGLFDTIAQDRCVAPSRDVREER